jgi:hypothetical protein
MNREKFSYDLNGDALYQQYKDQYMLGGQMAMQDTMGQAAAMTGGYGNSYAQGVGQQAYQGYLQQLNDKIPELYQLALDQYNREEDSLYKQYGLLNERVETDKSDYRYGVENYYKDLGIALDQYNQEENRGLENYWKGEEMDYSIFSDDRNLEHTLERENIDDAKYNQTFDEEQYRFDVTTALDRDKLSIDANALIADHELQVGKINQEFELAARKILEDERNGVISRDVAEREIDALEEKASKEKERIEAETAKIKAETAKIQAETEDGDEDPVDPEKDAFDGWGAAEWNTYFAQIRNSGGKSGGKAAAEKELEELMRQGVIPKEFVITATIGARGTLGH